MNKTKIIVADDSRVMRLMQTRFLEKDYEILEAENGERILELLKLLPEPVGEAAAHHHRGLLIISIELSDSNGIELARRIRQTYSMDELPIVLSTSHNKRNMIEQALKAGINDILVKPFPEELLVSKIRHTLNQVAESSRRLSREMVEMPFFRNIPPSAVAQAIEECADLIELSEDELVCAQGEENYDLFILLSGRCDVLFNERKVSTIEPVETIGEMGFLEDKPRSASVITREKSKLLVFRKEPFERYLNNDRVISEIICKNVIHTMSERIGKANRLIEQLKIIATDHLT